MVFMWASKRTTPLCKIPEIDSDGALSIVCSDETTPWVWRKLLDELTRSYALIVDPEWSRNFGDLVFVDGH